MSGGVQVAEPGALVSPLVQVVQLVEPAEPA
jgi:hypothetical protein